MTNTTDKPDNSVPMNNVYFWLGADGQMEGMTEAQFNKRQKNWDGPRPSDFDEQAVGG